MLWLDWGSSHKVAVLPAFKNASTSELFALVSGDPAKLTALGRKYSLEHLYSYNDLGRVLSDVDAVYLFCSEPIQVSAVAASRRENRFLRAEEMVSVIMRFPRERLATFTCSFDAADVGRYSLFGTKGILVVEPAYGYAKAIQHRISIGEKTTSQ